MANRSQFPKKNTNLTHTSMKTYEYQPQGVCCRKMTITVDGDRVVSASFQNGCHGNLQGIGALVSGMKMTDVISKLKGIRCGMKGTSCPDQLAHALEEIAAQGE